MKKTLTRAFVAILLAFGFVSLPIAPVFAADPAFIVIHGHVTDYDTDKRVYKAKVQAYCNGVPVFTAVLTDRDGSFDIRGSDVKCQIGGELTVTATINGKSDTSVSKISEANLISLRIKGAIVIPEYSWAGGILTTSIAIGMITLIRRRKVNI